MIPQLPIELSEVLLWSSHARAAYRCVPSLNRWYLSALSGEEAPAQYIYLVGVNDTATALATLVLIVQHYPNLSRGVESMRHIITTWTDGINVVGCDKYRVEESSTSGR